MIPSEKLKTLLAIGVFAAGALIAFPHMDYQPMLSTGDHGLNLYAGAAVLKGLTPYYDFHYYYGPLMLYFFAGLLKFLGTNILSILVGQAFLKVLSGTIFFFILNLFARPVISFVLALWFFLLMPDFFYTFNHSGGTLFGLLVFYALLFNIRYNTHRAYLWGLIAAFLLCWVKINIGLAALAGFIGMHLINDILQHQKIAWKKYILTALLFSGIILGAHWLMLMFLPFDILKQCFQYFGNDAFSAQYPSLMTNITLLFRTTWEHITLWKPLLVLYGFAAACLINIMFHLKKIFPDQSLQRAGLIALLAAGMFYLLFLHEFLISGVPFRMNWSQPFALVFIFLTIGISTRKLTSVGYGIATTLFVAGCLLGIQNTHTNISAVKTPERYLALERGKIFAGNAPAFTNTIREVTLFLDQTLKGDETFFAAPYEPLYYFLLDKTSPTRQLSFFEFSNITPDEQKRIIQDLKRNPAAYVLLSNRIVSNEPGLGRFGETHCRILGDYIKSHYTTIKKFGQWDQPAGWAWNHGVAVMKKKDHD